MGGLSTEYLQSLQKGLGGLGQGALLGQQAKQQRQQFGQRLDISALGAGFQRAPEGAEALPTDVLIGKERFIKSPTIPDPLEAAKLDKLIADTNFTIRKTELLGTERAKVDPGVRQVLMDFLKQTEGGVVKEELAGPIRALLQKIGAPLDVVQEVGVSIPAKLRNWISAAFKIPKTDIPLIEPSKEIPRLRGKFRIVPKQPTIADLSGLSTEDLIRLAQ